MNSKKSPEVTVLLTLGGDFLPEVVTNLLGVSPTRVWSQERPELAGRPDLNAVEWSVGVENLCTDNIDVAISQVLESIWERRSDIKTCGEKLMLNVSLVCNVTVWDEPPEYFLSSTTLGKLAEFGADFCLDIFDYSDD